MDRQDRNSQIHDAAQTLFSERGYHSSGRVDIVQAIGLQASSLYNHTSSKQGLLASSMLTTMEYLLARFDRLTAQGTPSQ